MKAVTKYWFLEGFNIFRKIGVHNMMQISDVMEMSTIEKGKTIELNSDEEKNIFFLKKGSVKIVDTKHNIVKHVIKRGNIFGELGLYNKDTTVKEVAYALEECMICYVGFQKMEELMEKHKSLKNGIFKIYGLRIQKLEQRINDLLYKDCSTRIREFTLNYLEEFGEKNEDGNLIAKNLLSHKDIANLTNTSRQSVSNTLSLMRKEGTIDYNVRLISNIEKEAPKPRKKTVLNPSSN